MTKFKTKIATAIATATFLLGSLTPLSFAQTYHIDMHDNTTTSDESFGAYKLFSAMDAHQEVPGPADPDGFGIARLRINPDSGQVCVNMKVFFITQATAAHIHQGATGIAGPIVVHLPTPDANGRANGCVTLDTTKVKDIINNPDNYYINVHNADYPDGAIRGQL